MNSLVPCGSDMVRVGSLFSGIGALDIAVHSVLGNSRTSWFVEREGFSQEILLSRFPGVPVHGDVKEVGCENLSPIDVLVGGFPCQDLSVAGNGAGISEGTRSGLFFEMWRIAQELQPRFVLFENVPVITSRGLDIVTETIIAAGWTIEWHCLAASDVGALHRRERWWGIAHREDPLFDGYKRVGQYQDGCRVLQGSLFGAPDLIERLPKAGMACADGLFERDTRGLATVVNRMWPTPSVSHAKRGNHDEPIEKYEERCLDYYEGRVKGKPGISLGVAVRKSEPVAGRLNPDWVEVLMGLPEGWTDPESQVALSMIDASSWSDGSWEEGVPRLTDRTDSRNKRLKALGNSVVPQCAAAAFKAVGLRMLSEPTLFEVENCWHCRREDCDIEIPEGVEVCVEFLE